MSQALLWTLKNWNFVYKLSKHISDKNNTSASIADPQPDINLNTQDTDALSVAVREAEEAYIKSRSISARKKGSSASNSTDGKDKEAVNR